MTPQPIKKPLWRLELERSQALRRFQRAEETYREAEKELHRINAEIQQRRDDANLYGSV